MKLPLLSLILAAAILLTACGSVTIARINADPTHYRNRAVTVTGVVTNSVGLMGTGGYQVDDGTGRIFVISRSGVPNKGLRVKVTGPVTSGVTILGQSYGTAIKETQHKVK